MAAKRTPQEIKRDDVFISEMYLKGYSYRQIATLIEKDKTRNYTLSHVQIGDDVKRMINDWREEQSSNIDNYVAHELQKIAYLEQQYHAAWEKSIKNFTRIKTKTANNYLGPSEEETQEEMVQYGDPRFLQGIERCIQKRCDLLGLDKPKTINIKTSMDVTNFTFESHPALKIA